MNEAQAIDELKARRFAFEVDANHRSRRATKLSLREFEVMRSFFRIGQICQTSFHAKSCERFGEQGERIAEKMFRGDDVLTLRGDGEKHIADGCHPTIECRHALRSRECFHAVFEMAHGGIARS